MDNFIRKHIWLLIFIGGISYLFITADPIDYCEKQGRYLSDQEYIDKVLMESAVALRQGIPASYDSDSSFMGANDFSSGDKIKPIDYKYKALLKTYFEQQPENFVLWHSKRHSYTTNQRLPINIRFNYIPSQKDCEYIMKNNTFGEIYKEQKKLNPGYQFKYDKPWIEQICKGDMVNDPYVENDKLLERKRKMIGFTTWILITPCGDAYIDKGSEPIFADASIPDIKPTFVEKYLK